MPLTTLAPSLGLVTAVVNAAGHDANALLRDCGIDPALLSDPGARVPSSKSAEIWQRGAELVGSHAFGIEVAEHWHPSYLGPLGYAWLTSPTLRVAIERLQRFSKFISEVVALEVVDDDERGLIVAFDLDGETHGARAIRATALVAVLVRMCRMDFDQPFDPVAVSFRHAAPATPARYYEFFRCPVAFGAERDAAVFGREHIDKHLPGDNPQLAHLNDRVMLDQMEAIERDELIGRVRRAVLRHMPTGDFSSAEIAREVGVSVRTLQRRLKERGYSLSGLVDEMRQQIAEQYVREGKLSLTEVALLLGFSQSAAFSRAFKRWTGVAPNRFSRRQTAE